MHRITIPVVAWLLGAAMNAVAQSDSADKSERQVESSAQLQTIVVTARKRVEDIQSVPISVTALSGADLANENVKSVNEVALTVPNMFITTSLGNTAAPSYTIRGQVQNDVTAAIDPSVGIYADGVYWARPYGSNAAFLDVGRVEVLKGPQGTLFGRNTTGGAVSIVTRDPSYDGVSGFASLAGGNQNEFDQTFGLNLPLVDERVAARLAVSHERNGGWVHNDFTGQEMMGSDQWMGRGKLLLTPNDVLRIVLSAELFDYKSNGPASKLIEIDPPFGANGQPFGLAALQAVLQSGGKNDGAGYAGGNPYEVDGDQKGESIARTKTYSATVELKTDWGNIKGIGAYRSTRGVSSIDDDGTPFSVADFPAVRSIMDQWTGEIQANGTSFSDRLNWTSGLFYFTESGFDDAAGVIIPAILPSQGPRLAGSDLENISSAGYFQGTYKLAPQWSLTGGLRYSVDNRYKQQYEQIVDPLDPQCGAGTYPSAQSNRCESAHFSRRNSGASYTLGLDYAFALDKLAYIKTSRGYRAGGFNSRDGAQLPGGESFGPETVTDYEVGLKSEYLDRRLRFNTAVYFSDYRNIQSSLLTIDTATNQPIAVVENAAGGQIYGFEDEVSGLITEHWLLCASAGYTHARYLKFVDLTGDRSNEQFPLTPKWTASASAQYTEETPIGKMLARVDYSFKGRVSFLADQNPPYTEAAGYGLVNARLSFTPKSTQLEFALYARNLLDKTYKTYAIDFKAAGLGFIAAQYGQPRQYGGEVHYNFGK